MKELLLSTSPLNLLVCGLIQFGLNLFSAFAQNSNCFISLELCTSLTCEDSQPFKLSGGLPLGGTYSGLGVQNNIFDPALAGEGNHTITYSYTYDFDGCTNSATDEITVYPGQTLVCGYPFIDYRDNNWYPTILIGDQCWMASNLNVGRKIHASNFQIDNCNIEKYCYSNDSINCAFFGGLYQWDELMNYNHNMTSGGICPCGWHVPSESEWDSLFSHFGWYAYAGDSLKASGLSGFVVFFVGNQYMLRDWYNVNFATMLWSSQESSSDKAWSHGMNIYNHSVSKYPAFKNNAFSVRCIKD